MYKSDFTLTIDDIEFYRSQGYLVKNAMYPDECDALLVALKKHADEKFSACHNLHEAEPLALAIMKHPPIVCAIDALQGCCVVALMSQILFKEAGSPYALQAWNSHQDNSYPKGKKGHYITCNILLADADKENGCMYVYPGSHEEDLLPFIPMKSFREDPGTSPGNLVQVPEKYRKVDLVLGKGSMLILHGHFIHGSYSNVSPTRSRPLFSFSYVPEGTDFISGDTARRRPILVH